MTGVHKKFLHELFYSTATANVRYPFSRLTYFDDQLKVPKSAS